MELVASNATLSLLDAYIEEIGLVAFIFRSLYIIVSVALMFINNTIIILVVRTTASLQSNTGCLMNYLAVTDYTIGIQAVISLVSKLNAGFILPVAACRVSSLLTSVAVSMTIYILTLMSIDRYILIVYPLRYPHVVTKRRVHIAVVIMFLIALALQSHTFLEEFIHYNKHMYICMINYQSYPYIVLIWICLCPGLGFLTMALCYLRIYYTSNCHRKRIDFLKGTKANITGSSHNSRALKTISVIIGVFALFWLPSCIKWLIFSFIDIKNQNPHSEFILKWLMFSNSYMNLFIYYKTNKSFNAGFRNLFKMKTVENDVKSATLVTTIC